MKCAAMLLLFVSLSASAKVTATTGGIGFYCASLGDLYRQAVGLRDMGLSPKTAYETVSRSAKEMGFKNDEAKQAVNGVYFDSALSGLSAADAAPSIEMACLHEAQGWKPIK